MRWAIGSTSLAMALLLTTPGPRSPQTQKPHLGRDSWYETLQRKLNPTRVNYGDWLEERRQALLSVSLRNPVFWYCFSLTLYSLVGTLAGAKYVLDVRRERWEYAQINAEIRNHDLYSREKAKEAIERYNQHVEECNRKMEVAESGDGRRGWSDPTGTARETELERLRAHLDATFEERNQLQEELRQKALVVTDLSLRLDALAQKLEGAANPAACECGRTPADASADGARLVLHVNRLQEKLYAERQKNKRVKGA
jgi:hypothetical protein